MGDERQAIYGFRGADVKNSKRMSEYVKRFNNDNISLNENFRSGPELINKIFTKSLTYNEKIIEFDKTPLLTPDPNRQSENEAVHITDETDIVKVINDIKQNKTLRGNPISYSDITILCRKNYMVDGIAEICKQANIPVEVMGGHGFYKAKEIIDIYKFLNYIVYKRDIYKTELLLTDAYKSFAISSSGNFNVFLDELCEYAENNSIELIIDYIIEKTNLDSFYMNNNG